MFFYPMRDINTLKQNRIFMQDYRPNSIIIDKNRLDYYNVTWAACSTTMAIALSSATAARAAHGPAGTPALPGEARRSREPKPRTYGSGIAPWRYRGLSASSVSVSRSRNPSGMRPAFASPRKGASPLSFRPRRAASGKPARASAPRRIGSS